MKKKNYLALPVSTILLFSSIYSGTVQAASVTGANSTVANQLNSGKNLRKSQMKEVPKASGKVLPKKAESKIETKLRDKLKNKQSVTKHNEQTGELIVKYKKKVTTGEITTLQKKYSLKSSKKLKNLNAEVVKIPSGESTSEYITKLKKDSNVESVQPNYKYYPSDFDSTPDYFNQGKGKLWGLNNTGQTINESLGKEDIDVNAPESWNQYGSKLSEVLVGVIDTGVDISHPDLKGKIWTNPGETGDGKENDGIDNDHDGYVDDVHGWDFYNDDNSVYDPLDGDEHGTHVSGTIAAELTIDKKGIVGVAPNVKIVPLKFLGPYGGTTADAIEAIEYAKNKGIKITNNSWSGGEYDPLLEEAIENSNSLFVAAAGNDGMDNDEEGAYPASYESSNILSVAAVDNKGNLASFSNYGAESVDVAAPGVDILSSVPKYPIDEILAKLKIKGGAGASAQIAGENYKAIFDGIGYEKIKDSERQDVFDKALSYLDIKDSKKILLVQDDEHDLAQIFNDEPELSKIFKDYSPIYNELLPNVDKVTISSESSLSDYKSSNDLSSYEAVVWYTGNGLGFFSEDGTTLTKNDTDMLKNYLSSGGKLLLSGVNALSGQEKSTFVKDTLGLNVYPDMGPSLNVKGLAGIYDHTNLNVNRFDFPYYFADFLQSNNSKAVINSEYVSDYSQAYDYYSGTSMATPHTTGTAAILLGLQPNMSPEMLKLYTSAKGTKLDSLKGFVGTGNMVRASDIDKFDDNDTPGVPLDKFVKDGKLVEKTPTSVGNKNDVYAISLKEGQGITFLLDGQAGTDFDLYVYNESTSSVNNKNGMVANSENVNTSKEKINFIAPRTGIYFVNVYDYKGTGNYKLYTGNFDGSYEDDSSLVTLDGDWMPVMNQQFSEQMAGVLNSKGEVSFSFVGSSIEWQGYKDPTQGIADVYIDGNKIASPSLYNSTFKSKQSLLKYEFKTYGNHSIRIVWAGKSDPAARKSATGINLDKFVVKENPISLKTSFDTNMKYPVISWTAKNWAEAYTIYRKESTEKNYAKINTIKTASYVDKTAKPGKKYDYVVTINIDNRETPFSSPITYVYDDDIKGRIYISGTAKGDLNTDAKDLNDVWAKNLEAGKTYEISLTGPTNANFDLSLYNIGTSSIYGSKELKKSASSTSNEKIVFKPTKTGMYYIVPFAVKGSGQYSINISVQTTKSVENNDSNIKYTGTWSQLNYKSASSGTINQTKGSTGSLQYNFSGTGITVYALKDKNMGRADIYIDGKKIKQVDLYSSSRKYKVNVFDLQNLANKAHTIKIVASGTKSSAATNKLINVDSFKLTQFSSVK
ncbi:S8 family serine peptidase [Gottfriedia acidiceleris]|uniref:S8 family serine peptidase n=1 Tax=Gottfriedia acidiceleris TaxID=371036 RepID=A0ABY4JR82_9BACI|nr:S8 family serine peptidase [Gottfriedia acidiceleris]UPM56338.1 S8 family serine peptidase [Gottfriedia acidiceleris]